MTSNSFLIVESQFMGDLILNYLIKYNEFPVIGYLSLQGIDKYNFEIYFENFCTFFFNDVLSSYIQYLYRYTRILYMELFMIHNICTKKQHN